MRSPLWFTLPAVVASAPVFAQKIDARRVLVADKSWNLLGQGYQLTGDSAVDGQGNVFFTDSRNNRILRIDLAGKISVWKEASNGAHGVAFGRDGRLYAGQHDRKRIVAFSSDGTESVIAEGVQSHHVTVTSRNEIYFTEGPAHKVWMADAADHKRVVSEGLDWPHGVRASADRSFLVVNDSHTRWVWKFRIRADGSLTGGKPFCRLDTRDESSSPDPGEMTFDSEGFLYIPTKTGIQVCDHKGRVAAIIAAPGGESVNDVFFAGPGLQWLYVTDGDGVYRRPAGHRGAALARNVNPRH